MKPSESVGVDIINLVRVDFTSDVDNSEALSRSLWSCCISATSSYVKSTIANVDRPLAEINKAAIFPISDAVQSLLTIFFTKVGYSRTSASSKMYHLLIAVAMNCALSFSSWCFSKNSLYRLEFFCLLLCILVRTFFSYLLFSL